MLTRRQILSAAAFGPFVIRSRAAEKRPNFLFLLTDDQSYATLGITGNPFMKTPHIDRLAREGALFTNGFVAMSLCAPSRSCFLTGLYPHTNGIHNNQTRWNQDLPTLPRTLHDAGYRTAHIGKFHMDGDERVQPGYDYWAAQVGQGSYENPRKNINGKWTDIEGYDTQIITDQAIEFMRSGRRDQPFCTWLAYKACHGPFTPAPGHERDFADLPFKQPASFASDNAGKPARVRRKEGGRAARAKRKAKKKGAAAEILNAAQWSERERNQYRALMGVEDSVGKIRNFLDTEKLLDDTIIFYSGDNGFFHGEHGLHGKMEPYEESIRVPMFVRYPKLIRGGQRSDAFIANVDLAPTILDFCGVKAPKPMQGRSWRPLVTGKNAPRRDAFLYEMFGQDADAAHPTVKAIRTDRYKLILNLNPQDVVELYDLSKDPQELHNIASDASGRAANRDLMQQLKRQMVASMRELNDPATTAIEAFAL